MSKTALITGITGQDGAYLSEYLLTQGYKVFGGYRRSSSFNLWRLEQLGIADKIEFISLDLLEFSNILKIIETINPNEIYNLAAQSFVAASFEQPLYTSEVDGLGVTRFLEAIRSVNPAIRFYQASTSEMFGKVRETPQTELTPFYPRSPYGVAKLYAHWMTVNYRESYGIHASSGILFNHESPLRGLEFVTRKITHQLVEIKYGKRQCLELGNLDAKRDWGYAGDFVRGMHAMLQQSDGDDYVLATGETHTVSEFVEQACHELGMNLAWQGEGINKIGMDPSNGKIFVKVNPQFFRPAEVELLLGDATKAKNKLAWKPRVTFQQLVAQMIKADETRFLANSINPFNLVE